MTGPSQLRALDGKQLNGKATREHRFTDPSSKYEKTALEDLRPCLFPDLDATLAFNGGWQSTEVPFRDADFLHSFCKNHGVASLAVLQLAWALVLRCYICSESVSLGSHVSSPETVMNRLGGTCDPFVKKSICHVEFEEVGSLLELLQFMQANLSQAQTQWTAPRLDVDSQASKREPQLLDTAISYHDFKQHDCSVAYESLFPIGAGQGSGKVSSRYVHNH